jgi:hypothetical protein
MIKALSVVTFKAFYFDKKLHLHLILSVQCQTLASYKISTGCKAILCVPSLIWCLQEVPAAATIVSG